MQAGEPELEAALDWTAGQMMGPDEDSGDSDYRFLLGNILLNFPRERFHDLLLEIAVEQLKYGMLNATFSRDDVALAYSGAEDQPEWAHRPEPWSFYDEAEILKRQASRIEEEELRTAHVAAPKAPPIAPPRRIDPVETYVRATPKLGRNDPCHCGSGKKYKQCCMAADAAGKP